MQNLGQFSRKNYLNMETFRRNGEGVKTPVWFVQDGEGLYVKTFINSGKVKRIRNNPQIKIVPSKVDGRPIGEWISASGAILSDEPLKDRVEFLYNKKYGLLKKLFFRSRAEDEENYCLLELKMLKEDHS